MIMMEREKELTTIEYRELVIVEMLKLGATKQDIELIKDATINNAIKRKRKPEDVAWALLQ